eukprot:scaffold3079_cov174-Amphora_coffeaeformis.AAC.8
MPRDVLGRHLKHLRILSADIIGAASVGGSHRRGKLTAFEVELVRNNSVFLLSFLETTGPQQADVDRGDKWQH